MANKKYTTPGYLMKKGMKVSKKTAVSKQVAKPKAKKPGLTGGNIHRI